jgi:hypothetical protein
VHGDADTYVALYDAQAVRLHAYCWSLVGDRAAATVHEVFAAAARPEVLRPNAGRRDASRPAMPPSEIRLYHRARAECLRRGPVTVISGRDPLLRAAARLRADQREALVLAADFAPVDVARVLAVPPEKAIQLVTAARTRLEQATLNVLLADPAMAAHEDIIGAFEKGALGTLLARRAPAPPTGLRQAIIDTLARERAPLVVISGPAKPAQSAAGPKGRPAARHARAAAPVIGVAAACAAAVVGAVAAGAALDFDGTPAGGGQGALAPSSAEHGRQSQAGQPGPPGQTGQGARPGSGESPNAGVTPTSAAPRPAVTTPGEAPAPASSNSSADETSSAFGGRSPNADRQSSSAPSASAADRETPSPSPSGSQSASPSPTPSGTPPESPPDDLLSGLPILGKAVSDALSSATRD